MRARKLLPVLGVGYVLLMIAPVGVAQAIMEKARNADKVDGFHAVGARTDIEDRGRRLVATNRRGFLPNEIVRRVRTAADADRLGGLGPRAYIERCAGGSLRGQAIVRSDVGSTYEVVDGFSTFLGGPVDPDTGGCHTIEIRARRVSTGVYRVKLGNFGLFECPDVRSDSIGAVVTVSNLGDAPLIADYRPVCDDGGVAEVRIFDLDGQPQDAGFTMAVLSNKHIPVP
jgi:hypothetical protein